MNPAITPGDLIARATELTDRSRNFAEFMALAEQQARDLPERAIFLDIGTRRGATALGMLAAVLRSNQPGRWVWSVDPYGNRPYASGDTLYHHNDYGEAFYREMLHELAAVTHHLELNWCHWRMTSAAFAEMLSGGEFSFWHDHRRLEVAFGFVSLDGEHTQAAVDGELMALWPRVLPGGAVLIDDADRIGVEWLDQEWGPVTTGTNTVQLVKEAGG